MEWTEKPSVKRALDQLRGEIMADIAGNGMEGFVLYGLPMALVKVVVGAVRRKMNYVTPPSEEELKAWLSTALAGGVTWKICKGPEKPRPSTEVLLHTPQYADTLGVFIVGSWSGDHWEAIDGRDLDDFPPVHYATINVPEFEGDDEDWKNMGLDDGDHNQEEDPAEEG